MCDSSDRHIEISRKGNHWIYWIFRNVLFLKSVCRWQQSILTLECVFWVQEAYYNGVHVRGLLWIAFLHFLYQEAFDSSLDFNVFWYDILSCQSMLREAVELTCRARNRVQIENAKMSLLQRRRDTQRLYIVKVYIGECFAAEGPRLEWIRKLNERHRKRRGCKNRSKCSSLTHRVLWINMRRSNLNWEWVLCTLLSVKRCWTRDGSTSVITTTCTD